MTRGTDSQKFKLINAITERIGSKMTGKKAALATCFAEGFFANVAADDLVSQDPEDLYGAAMSLFNFGFKYGGGGTDSEPLLRVFNPRREQHGWRCAHTIVEIVHADMPFLVDSVTMELNRRGLAVHLVIHPVFSTSRDTKGQLTNVDVVGDGVRESHMHIEVDEQHDDAALLAIKDGLMAVLEDNRAAVADWTSMRGRLQDIIAEIKSTPPDLPKAEIAEGLAFLQWLYDDHFTFLGYRDLTYAGTGKKAKMTPGNGMGILRDDEFALFEGLRNLGAQTPEVQAFVREPKLLLITKGSRLATVHRSVPLDTIGIKQFGPTGKIIGERLFTGLFTSGAYSETPRKIPLLRRKVDAVMKQSGYGATSHDGKALMHVLEDYPRDELFQTPLEDLNDITRGIVHLQERQRTALFMRLDPYERYVSAIIFLPRVRLDTMLQHKFETILADALDGELHAGYAHVTDEPLGRLHFIIKTTPGAIPDFDIKDIEARLIDAGQSWGDRLKSALVEHHGEAHGGKLFTAFGNAFPTKYRERYDAQTAVYDCVQMDDALKSGELGMNLYRPIEADDNALSFKIYNAGDNAALSDILPMLENMGLKVMTEESYSVTPQGADQPLHIHDFALVTGDGAAVDFGAVRTVFHDSFARVWRGDIEDDGFNRLVLCARLSWRDVVLLRAFAKFLRQAQIPFSQAYMEETLARNPDLTRLLVRQFKLRLDPDFDGDRDQLEGVLGAAVEQAFESVANLDEDRILRRYANLINATLRTNFFCASATGEPEMTVAFKFDSRSLDELPLPKPLREIWVYCPRFEAVHLRFGMVARGGLRWSDRREDFRTEILGLVKAQQVKNAVIVPVGSKGGFVLKKAPQDRDGFQEEGVACYKLFMRAMLSITDNLIAGAVAPPVQVVRRDGDDPYLVVAADKGTATFSDIANAEAIDHGFWLGDAFASGGSVGYDHKKMAITARGAWESVMRHFRELGHDTQSEDFTVVGCGDMSGDVFGNGMLLSEHIKLVGAFNHMHIFIDPDPNPKASFTERRRLFDLPRSAWSDYDKSLLSKGAAIFDRSSKSLKLTPEIQSCFDIESTSVTPNELITAMLKANIDLLWFGGIGTYVKGAIESHADAGDRANDALRVNGAALRCKVIGEGANLGVTQRGRIDFARAGGRVNTDFIDNSAGVDCSDHEVNIKILFGDYIERSDMTEKQRNVILESMTDEVGLLCLEDNYAQTQSISVTESQAANVIDQHRRLMRTLERADILNREIEFLPDDEQIDNLEAANEGLTRPEISVLLAYAKNATYEALLASRLPDDPLLIDDLVRYFPEPLRETYRDGVERHQLRREIVATSVTNAMINRAGPTFVNEMCERTGLNAAAITRAFAVVRETFGLRELWDGIEALDNCAPPQLQIRMLREINRTVDRVTLWFLRNAPQPLDMSGLIAEFGPGVAALAADLDDVLQRDQRQDVRERTLRYTHDGVPVELSDQIGRLKMLSCACDIVRLAGDNRPARDVGRTYFAIGSHFRLDWLRREANLLAADNTWRKLAIDAIVDDLWGTQDELSREVLKGEASGRAAIEGWIALRPDKVRRVNQLIGELQSAGRVELAMLAVANRELRELANER
jgi:glutamate dehydrogenase